MGSLDFSTTQLFSWQQSWSGSKVSDLEAQATIVSRFAVPATLLLTT